MLGYARFCDLRVVVRPPVFVPRRRAEALALAATSEVRSRPPGATVLDLGCGAGAIAAAVATSVGAARVWASDVSEAAVDCARVNAARFGFAVVASDWWTGLPGELLHRLDVVAAYLPHVPDARLHEIPADHRRWEEGRSVRGGADGLDAVRALLPDLGRWLAPGGVLLTLLADEQRVAASALAAAHGWRLEHRAVDGGVIAAVRYPPDAPLHHPPPLSRGTP